MISMGIPTTPPIYTPDVLSEPQLAKEKILGDLINTYRGQASICHILTALKPASFTKQRLEHGSNTPLLDFTWTTPHAQILSCLEPTALFHDLGDSSRDMPQLPGHSQGRLSFVAHFGLTILAQSQTSPLYPFWYVPSSLTPQPQMRSQPPPPHAAGGPGPSGRH